VAGRRDVPKGDASITIGRRFKKSQHVFRSFAFRGNQIDTHSRGKALTFRRGDATAETGCAFSKRHRQTRSSFARLKGDAIAGNERAPISGRPRWRCAARYRPKVPPRRGRARIDAISARREIPQRERSFRVSDAVTKMIRGYERYFRRDWWLRANLSFLFRLVTTGENECLLCGSLPSLDAARFRIAFENQPPRD